MLHLNLFRDTPALLETDAQGDASVPVKLPQTDEDTLRAMLDTPEASSTLARLFLSGVNLGVRRES